MENTLIFPGFNINISIMKKFLTLILIILFTSSIFAEGSKSFVVARSADGVTVNDEAILKTSDDLKDPFTVLVKFFKNYLENNEKWKDYVYDNPASPSKKDFLISAMLEAYEDLYGSVDSITITINEGDYKDSRYGNGTIYYSISLELSFEGETESGTDEVTMVRDDETGFWYVIEIPQ